MSATTPSTAASTSPSISGATWALDASHSSVEFSVKHLMISSAKGRFGAISGSFTLDPASPASVGLEIAIQTASVDTRDEQRDAHLRSADFFNADVHPLITFVGRRVEGDINREFRLIGDLTIRGRTKEVVLTARNEGRMTDPWGNEKLGFSASTKVNRLDFDLRWNVALEAGGMLVGEEVRISIEAQFARQAA